jgi:hypothetical protein
VGTLEVNGDFVAADSRGAFPFRRMPKPTCACRRENCDMFASVENPRNGQPAYPSRALKATASIVGSPQARTRSS